MANKLRIILPIFAMSLFLGFAGAANAAKPLKLQRILAPFMLGAPNIGCSVLNRSTEYLSVTLEFLDASGQLEDQYTFNSMDSGEARMMHYEMPYGYCRFSWYGNPDDLTTTICATDASLSPITCLRGD